jgi:hypothetical protein
MSHNHVQNGSKMAQIGPLWGYVDRFGAHVMMKSDKTQDKTQNMIYGPALGTVESTSIPAPHIRHHHCRIRLRFGGHRKPVGEGSCWLPQG